MRVAAPGDLLDLFSINAFIMSSPAWLAVCSIAPATSSSNGLIGSTI